MHSCTLAWTICADLKTSENNSVEKFLDEYGYIALMIGTFFEGETSILVASSLIHRGLFEGPYTVLFGFAGSFISDWLYYLIGRLNGKYFIERRPKLKEKFQPVVRFFLHHKIQILFTYRFLYGFRIIIPLIIGMSNIKPFQFLIYSIVSGLIWSTTVSTVGYFVGRFLNLKTEVYEENILFIVLGFACFGALVGFIVKRVTMKEIAAEANSNA
ncbi:membrane protein DedA, SNARE-associated domain [Ohtaekwangia koreensis]|uniref:Membrane protein DedA, SNARE-associated domain n=1 Tax=Ohtaekwangia koreensis TaxID=688867 RepID=A0A1T5MM89_9BACT|nr:membrane protein DedA, SNARE-associated domain [Ohtaekwangia koreensis]